MFNTLQGLPSQQGVNIGACGAVRNFVSQCKDLVGDPSTPAFVFLGIFRLTRKGSQASGLSGTHGIHAKPSRILPTRSPGFPGLRYQSQNNPSRVLSTPTGTRGIFLSQMRSLRYERHTSGGIHASLQHIYIYIYIFMELQREDSKTVMASSKMASKAFES